MGTTTVFHIVSASCFLFLLHMCDSSYWDYFVYTQEWPQSACMVENATDHRVCLIPSNVTTWTVHGLWPSKSGTKDLPQNCNKSWPFKEHDILPLESKLRKFWPNLYKTTSHSNYSAFWAHEWDKHGTCCTDQPDTRDEYHYFSQGLLLNMKYNLTSFFAKNKITPGANFSLSYIQAMLKGEFGEVPVIQCAIQKIPNVTEHQFIYQVELCLDKCFAVKACPGHHKYFNIKQGMHLGKGKIVAGSCSAKIDIQYPHTQHQLSP